MRIFWIFALLTGLAGQRAAAQAPATDVLLLTTGAEVRGRVLTISPTELRYLPAPDSAAARPSDTLRLPVAAVFLVRYANGTRELLAARRPVGTPPALVPGTEPLLGLSGAERRQLGQRDALRCYHKSGPYWGAFGSTLYLGPLLGLGPTIGIGSVPVHDYNLQAPKPPLLADADYAQGYRAQAHRSKRGRAWGGYGTATGLYVLLLAVALGSLGN